MSTPNMGANNNTEKDHMKGLPMFVNPPTDVVKLDTLKEALEIPSLNQLRLTFMTPPGLHQ